MIYLDSRVLIYAVELNSQFSEQVVRAIDAHPGTDFAISPLVKLECVVKPIESGNTALKRYIDAAFDTMITLTMPDQVYTDAAMLRARFRLRTPDALHLSCAQFHQCEALWTNDDRLLRAAYGLAVNICSTDSAGPK